MEKIVNVLDDSGWSALALAVSNGHLHCAKLLLDFGAEPVPRPHGRVLGLASSVGDCSVPCAYLIALHRLGWEHAVRKSTTADGFAPSPLPSTRSLPSPSRSAPICSARSATTTSTLWTAPFVSARCRAFRPR